MATSYTFHWVEALSLVFIYFRYLMRTTSCGELVAEVTFAGIERFPMILSGILILLTAASGCGELALCLAALCQFLHLFSMYKVRASTKDNFCFGKKLCFLVSTSKTHKVSSKSNIRCNLSIETDVARNYLKSLLI